MLPIQNDSGSALHAPWHVEITQSEETSKTRGGLTERAAIGLKNAGQTLLKRQEQDGHWQGRLACGPALASQMLLLEIWLKEIPASNLKSIANDLLHRTLPTGGWNAYQGGPFDLTTSVQAYMALKGVGIHSDDEKMRSARSAIRAAGGAETADSLTRFFLALLGQIDYEHCLEIPPSLLLLPPWVPLHPKHQSAWLRIISIPLSVLSAYRPVRELAESRGVKELFCSPQEDWPLQPLRREPSEASPFSGMLARMTPTLKWLRHRRIEPFRKAGLEATKKWIAEHLVDSDGLGGNAHSLILCTIALRCLGYAKKSAEMQSCREQLATLSHNTRENRQSGEENGTRTIQPIVSAVSDTALAIASLNAANIKTGQRPLRRSVKWLLDREIRRRGDWANRVDTDPGGWSREYHNVFYPNITATADAMLALRAFVGDVELAGDSISKGGSGGDLVIQDDSRIIAAAKAINLDSARRYIALLDRTTVACERARLWLLSMQNQDGGWGAFDQNNRRRQPFSPSMPLLNQEGDQSSPDSTGAVLEAFGMWGERSGRAAIDRGIAYLRETQSGEGSWVSRWGGGRIHGTWRALAGLAGVGLEKEDPTFKRGSAWLVSNQLACGGWGESPRTFDAPNKATSGPATPTQTAWAILALIAAGQGTEKSIERGVQYLLKTQNKKGHWNDPSSHVVAPWPGSLVSNDLYEIAYPLLAIAAWLRAKKSAITDAAPSLSDSSSKMDGMRGTA